MLVGDFNERLRHNSPACLCIATRSRTKRYIHLRLIDVGVSAHRQALEYSRSTMPRKPVMSAGDFR